MGILINGTVSVDPDMEWVITYCDLQTGSGSGRLTEICKYLSFLGNTITANKTIKWIQITKGRREVVEEKISNTIEQEK